MKFQSTRCYSRFTKYDSLYEYKDKSILKELCDNNLIQLSKCRRSDDTLFNLICVGYAFTTHSCQGITINEPYTINFDRMHNKLKMMLYL